ncbi:MAG: tRNA-guanine transglycosylase DpdA [Prochlorotrichaceae cyanobacterium]|jgi:hypothetical protein
MEFPRVLVITSCTGEKRYKPDNQLTLKDFQDIQQLQQREFALQSFLCPAGELYTGNQHLRLMEGVKALRETFGKDVIDVKIISAGYGLVSEDQTIAPYEVTFNGMKAQEVDTWARHLGIHDATNTAIQKYDLIFFLLGDNYLRALSLPLETNSQQTLIFLAPRGQANSIKGMSATTFVMPLSNPEAKKYHYGLVGLKGHIFKHFAEAISLQHKNTPDRGLLEAVYREPKLFVETVNWKLLEQEQQLTLTEILQQVPSRPVTKAVGKTQSQKPPERDLLKLPDIPPAPNQHLGMYYFIPEWDDRVYPRYDFIKDESPGRQDPYQDDVYAHEIYPSPNYDGILISKIVIDESAKRREAFEAVGVHQYVRFPGEIMGDCGAFGYIGEDVPPYETDEILDYYQALGFNYGVSIDHLIVGPFAQPGVREMRYDLTQRNAQDFLEKHRKHGYTFTPIGVAQGWDPESYAEAVKALIEMGYNFIAIGGVYENH